ncbi:hypothetical protein NL529_29940, partial [Klebsiella pneumoniae]|nr:hypothetical protein [Klebsiella pneumoniae]
KLTADQEKFLDHAIDGLAEKNQVVAVRLCLFAEMMKTKSWTPAELKALGGAAGVGVAFLEDAFGPNAPVAHRSLIKPVTAILSSLLP